MNSPYRKDADYSIDMYERGEIANVKTAINLVSTLKSTRPEATASKINEYLSVKKSLHIKPVVSRLDANMDEDEDYIIKPTIKHEAIRSRPKPKAKIVSIKKKNSSTKPRTFFHARAGSVFDHIWKAK